MTAMHNNSLINNTELLKKALELRTSASALPIDMQSNKVYNNISKESVDYTKKTFNIDNMPKYNPNPPND